MSTTDSPLLGATIDRVRAGWAAKLTVNVSALINPGITLVPKESSKGVFVLELQHSAIVVCPSSLLSILSPLSHNDLLDMTLLLRVLDGYQPNPFGTATIAYADVSSLRGSSNSDSVRVANTEEVNVVMSSCTQSEQEESGVADMPILFAVQSAEGHTGAIAGYEAWNADIAQMGVLASPEQRGHGLAFKAAYAAAQAALEAELIPQWRCRIGNQSSYRLGQRLGFYELGSQLAIDL